MRHALLILPFLAFFLFPGTGNADIVYTKAGKTIEGIVLEDGPDNVRINLYYSNNPRMTRFVVTLPKNQVARVVIARPKIQEYLRRFRDLEESAKAEEHYALALWCKKNRLKIQMKESARLALLADPGHEGARKILGTAAKKFLEERKKFREEIVPLIMEYVAAVEAEARKSIHQKIKKAGFKKPQAYLERVARSFGSPKGLRLDRKIVYRAETFPGAVYSLQVPKNYDPLRPWPLVLGLHGGGPAGKDGKEVVGSGSQAMQKYKHEAERRGYILVCPSAVTAPWSSPQNGKFIVALLTETVLTYNVDLNRVYLVGHSMGGGGTWHYGPKWAETFASISPLSAYSSGGFTRLHRTGTGVYIYHGDNDNRCPVDSSRTAAKALKKKGADFRYTEIPGSGHSCPMYIVKEVFDFFDVHRLSPAKKNTLFGVRATPWGAYSSFQLPVTPEEKKYLSERKASGIAALINDLCKGGGAAEKAALAIARHEEKDRAVAPLRGLLFKSENRDVQRLSAWALGEIGSKKSLPSLGAALDDSVPAVRSAAAEALAKIGGEEATGWITRGAGLFLKHFESRLVGGHRIDSVDWEKQVECLIRYLRAAGKIGNEKTAGAIGKTVFDGLLLGDIDVDYDKEVQPDPNRSLKKLALAALKTLETLKSPVGIEPIKKLIEKMERFPEVVAEGKRVLGVLGE